MLALDAEDAGVENHNALDDVFEFANVAGPVILGEVGEGFFADLHAGAAILATELGEEFAGEERDVLLAFAEGRHEKRNDVEAIEEVFAEVALGDFLFEILVGAGDEAHVDAKGLGAADRGEELIVECAEDLGLSLEAHVADFVKIERASIGTFEGAALFGRAAGLRAVAIAEELGLNVIFRDGGAVELDEDAVAAQALGVNGAGDEFLAGAGFAVDEDAAVGWRHQLDLLAKCFERHTFAGEDGGDAELALELLVFRAETAGLDGILDDNEGAIE